jgi:hypothetical protein
VVKMRSAGLIGGERRNRRIGAVSACGAALAQAQQTLDSVEFGAVTTSWTPKNA